MALEMIDKLNVPPERLVLGGFSQGAMLATELVLRMPTPPAGLAILSGTLVNEVDWKERATKLKGFQFFQAHGQRDTVLGFKQAKRLETLLREAGWVGQLQEFAGGHEIPSEVIIRLGAYLRKVTS
jgi:phospholipase/carboxylesterase